MEFDNTLTSEDRMPFGKYAGTLMKNVPDWYLSYFYETASRTPTTKPVFRYIESYKPHLTK